MTKVTTKSSAKVSVLKNLEQFPSMLVNPYSYFISVNESTSSPFFAENCKIYAAFVQDENFSLPHR